MNISSETIISAVKYVGAIAAAIVSITAAGALYWSSDLPRFASHSELMELSDIQARSEIDYRSNRNHWDRVRLQDLKDRIETANPSKREEIRELRRQMDDLEERIAESLVKLERARKRLDR